MTTPVTLTAFAAVLALVFGALAGWLLCLTPPVTQVQRI